MAAAPRPSHAPVTATVRPLAPADLDACVALLRETYESDRYPVRWPADPRGWLTGGDVLGAWVAERAGEIVGHLVVKHPNPDRLWPEWRATVGGDRERVGVVSRFFVGHGARTHGIGMALMERAQELALARGLLLVLEVADHNVEATAFYRRRGWREVGEATFDLSDGTPLHVRLFTGPSAG